MKNRKSKHILSIFILYFIMMMMIVIERNENLKFSEIWKNFVSRGNFLLFSREKTANNFFYFRFLFVDSIIIIIIELGIPWWKTEKFNGKTKRTRSMFWNQKTKQQNFQSIKFLLFFFHFLANNGNQKIEQDNKGVKKNFQCWVLHTKWIL